MAKYSVEFRDPVELKRISGNLMEGMKMIMHIKAKELIAAGYKPTLLVDYGVHVDITDAPVESKGAFEILKENEHLTAELFQRLGIKKIGDEENN